jgi:hypothetical protein
MNKTRLQRRESSATTTMDLSKEYLLNHADKGIGPSINLFPEMLSDDWESIVGAKDSDHTSQTVTSPLFFEPLHKAKTSMKKDFEVSSAKLEGGFKNCPWRPGNLAA